MITPSDIAKNLQRLRGDTASGRLFDDKGRELNAPARPPQWRTQQHKAAGGVPDTFTDIIWGTV